ARRVMRSSWSPGQTSVLVVLALPFLYPFFFLVATALKPIQDFNADEIGLPSNPTLHNVGAAWHEAGLGFAMLHSVIAVLVAVVATVVISALGAFWFLYHDGRGARLLRYALIA